MDSFTIDQEKDASEEQLLDNGAMDSSEEGFIKGFSAEEEIEECAECGSAINPEKRVVKEIEDETHKFCSKECALEFIEGLA